MAGGVQSFLKTANTAAGKLATCGDRNVEISGKAIQTAIKKAEANFKAKKVKAKASLQKLENALDTVKTCLTKKPAADIAGAVAAVNAAKTASTATAKVAASPAG